MKNILIAGATGNLGKAAVVELKRRGYRVKALVRDAGKLNDTGRMIDEIFVGDVTRKESLAGICDDVDVVFSALGAPLTLSRTPKNATYRQVDYQGNKFLLDEARRAAVKKVVYVSLCGAHLLGDCEYVRAHEDFVCELETSGVRHTVVRPTGFFSVLSEVVKLARHGVVFSIGDGQSRTNPIHEADLAVVCADAVEDIRREIIVGGEESYTRREIAELAFESLGKRPRIVPAPAGLIKKAIAPIELFDKRLHSLLYFAISVQQVDALAPAFGVHSLRNYFHEIAHNLNH